MRWHLRKFINRVLYSGEPTLRGYEFASLVAFANLLPKAGKKIFWSQLHRYDRVQRSPNGKHLSFFDDDSDPLCRAWPPDSRFPYFCEPSAVASISIPPPPGTRARSTLNGEVFLFEGRVAGLEFLREPSAAFIGTDEFALAELSPERAKKVDEYGAQARILVHVMNAARINDRPT